MRLDKFLSDRGVGTRSRLRELIRSGAVTVGGAVEKDPGAAVSAGAEIRVQGRALDGGAHAYWMVNKPAGVLSAAGDSRGDRTVMELLPPAVRSRRGMSPVGRLDRDTEGLLLVTDDGALAHRLLSPKKHVEKVYLAISDGAVGGAEIERFHLGMALPAVHAERGEAFVTLPARLEVLRPDAAALAGGAGDKLSELVRAHGAATPTLVALREGKYHQIRRMFAACGHEVLYLKRLSMGPIGLDPSLAPGECRALTGEELAALARDLNLMMNVDGIILRQ